MVGQNLLDDAVYVGEFDLAVQEGVDRDFVGGAEDSGVGTAFLRGIYGQPEAWIEGWGREDGSRGNRANPSATGECPGLASGRGRTGNTGWAAACWAGRAGL